MKFLLGDNIEHLKAMADNSVDSVVTDAPYGLGKSPDPVKLLQDWLDHGYHEVKGSGFMGKKWDAFVPQPLFWKEVYRVLKPGGHVLCFFGTRTYDWGVMAMRLAGFDVRDCIQWVYGSGFPKSMDISKAIDKQAGAEREITGVKPGHEGFANRGNLSSVQSLKGTMGGEGGFSRPWMEDPEKVEKYHMATAPATDEAKQWDGWGTALKPANEPIVLARKPISESTVADNVLKWGTGGMNIDGCRVGIDPVYDLSQLRKINRNKRKSENGWGMTTVSGDNPDVIRPEGRFPANLIHDGSDEVVGLFPESKGGSSVSGKEPSKTGDANCYGEYNRVPFQSHNDSGSAARFFYCAKSSKKERGEYNKHPTVKPVALMRYLTKLVNPPGGVCLDPFGGSGSTAVGWKMDGVDGIYMEMDEESYNTAVRRVDETEYEAPEPVKPKQQTLF